MDKNDKENLEEAAIYMTLNWNKHRKTEEVETESPKKKPLNHPKSSYHTE